MKAVATNLGLRFYEMDGWTFDKLNASMNVIEYNSLIYFKDKFAAYFIFKKASDETKKNILSMITEVRDVIKNETLTREKNQFEFEHLIMFNFD
jgi:hypothetical protein